MRPLSIFPEGCSTSGEFVIQIKKGAFSTLKAVKPYSAKTWSLTGISANSGGTLDFFKLTTVTGMTGFFTYQLQEMPVFEPNEYFWKHHWDGKEDKWKTYARVMQKLIAKQSGLKTSDSWVTDKLAYKKLVRAKTAKQN